MLTPKSEDSLPMLEGYHYRLLRRIRKTRMSEVWLAEETTTGQRVIIKFALIGESTDPNQRAILNDERWLRHLNHPSIIKVLPIQETPPARDPVYRARALTLPGTPWFIVEIYLAGGSMADILEKHGKFDLAAALRVAKHMFEVLVYLRQANCVHNDQKTANWVWVLKFDPTNPDPRMWQPMLIDFGIAQTLGEKIVPAIAPGWSPAEVEQAYHAHTLLTADASWDVYGVALMLQAMLTGQPKPDLDPAKRYTGLHLTRADLAGDNWVSEHDLDVIERKLNQLLERTINGAPFVRPKAEEFVAELDTLLRLIKPKPAWVRSIEPFFHWLIGREIQKSEAPSRILGVPNWASAFVMTFLVLLITLAVIFGLPELSFPLPSPVSAGSNETSTITATQQITPSVAISPTLVSTAEITNTVVATPVVTVEQPTATATPEPTPSATATTAPATDTPTATATVTPLPTETATFTPTPTNTPTATATNTAAREPVTPQPASIPEPVTVTPAPPPRPTLDQRVITQISPLPDEALNVKEPEPDKRKRERIFEWAYQNGFDRRGVCAELLFRYPLQHDRSQHETVRVADVSDLTRYTVDLPGWFQGRPVAYGGVTFTWGVRVFFCGTRSNAEPAEWRAFTLTRQ